MRAFHNKKEHSRRWVLRCDPIRDLINSFRASHTFPEMQHPCVGPVTAGYLRLNSLLSRARPANSLKSRSTRPFCLFLIDFLCALLLSHVEDGSAAAAERRNLRRVFGPAKVLPDHRLPAKGDACDAHAGLAGPVLRAGPGGCARHGLLMDNGSAGGAGGWGCGRHGVAGGLDAEHDTCSELVVRACLAVFLVVVGCAGSVDVFVCVCVVRVACLSVLCLSVVCMYIMHVMYKYDDGFRSLFSIGRGCFWLSCCDRYLCAYFNCSGLRYFCCSAFVFVLMSLCITVFSSLFISMLLLFILVLFILLL